MEITEIKTRLPISQVLNYYSLTTDKNNRVCCPWHDDKAPSLQIYSKTNSWTCFSSNCKAGSGDVIDFIMKYEKITKHEALVKAKELINPTNVQKQGLSRQSILSKYYQSTVHSFARNKAAKEYAESRGLRVKGLGYCSYTMGKTWDKRIKEQAKEKGLLNIKNCLIFPMKDQRNEIVSFYGRSLSINEHAKHFYLKGGFKGLYPSYPKTETQQLILTESIIDARSISQQTEIEVLALYGTNGWTKEHESAIQNLKQLNEVILFFDGDEAGRAAVKKYNQILAELVPQVEVSYVQTPQGEDPNSLLQSHEGNIIQHLIDQRIKQDVKPSAEIGDKSVKSSLNTENSELLKYSMESLLIYILGGIKLTGLERLRVTLKIELQPKKNTLPIRHSLDLYNAKQVEQLIEKVSENYELGKAKTEQIISRLTDELEGYREQKMAKTKPNKKLVEEMTSLEKQEALSYLNQENLLSRTLKDIARTGIVGEQNNALIAYLAYTSRKREKPLHIMCLGKSGIGKTYLQEKVSELIPEEEKIEITSLSDNALYYFGRYELRNKLVLIEDLDGAQNALYPLREIQSKRRISKTVTTKDTKGNLSTVNLIVEGPVCVSSCTTRERVYEDNANRCILLYIDASYDQSKRVMDYQKSLSSGKVNQGLEREITKKLQNVQRLLKPIKIVNPYAELIDLPQEIFKPRRTLTLLLSFIETISYYHQYQREIKYNGSTTQRYIESTREDIVWAFRLLKEVLFTKSDELSKATRRFLERLKLSVKDGESFYSQEIRKQFRLSSSSVHRYIQDLSRNGYIKYVAGNKTKGYEYQIMDYEEYQKLKDRIDEKLDAILSSIPVSQSYPSGKNGIIKDLSVSDLS